MDNQKRDFPIDPEAQASIDLIVEGIRRYLMLLIKDRTHEERPAKESRRK